MSILWLKALHLFFMVAWFAGIFYLPRLFVYHAEASEPEVHKTLIVMEHRLWWFVLPFAILTLVFGVWLILSYGMAWFKQAGWLHIKILLVTLIYLYYGYLYYLMRQFAQNLNSHNARFYRILNETPVLILLAVILLAVLKPAFW
ncbi:MAG: CopD family protein [Aestuariibacter sp.]